MSEMNASWKFAQDFVRTPRSARTVVLIAAVLFLTAPVVVVKYFYAELQRGSFPIEADAIGIPIFAFVVLQIVTAPISLGIVWLCVRRYRGAVSLLAWNRERQVWLFLWTFVCLALAALLLAAWSDFSRHPFLALHAAADIWLLVVLRSGLVVQQKSVPRPA
jgi:hypothetical protein